MGKYSIFDSSGIVFGQSCWESFRMKGLVYTIVVGFLARVGEASYPTACSAYKTCGGLQGDCCPNMDGINLACCFSGALMKDAAAAEKEAKAVQASAAAETAAAASAAAAAKKEAEAAKKTTGGGGESGEGTPSTN